MTLPFEGIRVLDWSCFQQGPTTSVLLADMGADVIKIEPPEGEPARGLLRILGLEMPVDFYYTNQNRGKRGIVLDFSKEAAREVLYKLVAKADVFVTNYRYIVAKNLKLDYETVSKYNPKLIYVLSTGYGMRGPDADQPSADFAGQARGGICSITCTEDGTPLSVGAGLADEMGGFCGAYAAVLGLLIRQRTGIGQLVEASLLGGAIEIVRLWWQYYLMTGKTMPGCVFRNANSPLWNLYRCQDDKWFVVSVSEPDKYWHQFCEVLGIQKLETAPKFKDANVRSKHYDELMPQIREILRTKPREEWLDKFTKAGLTAAPVNEMADVVPDPQAKAMGYVLDVTDPDHGKVTVPGIPVKLSKTPGKVTKLAHQLGQHTEEVLMEVLGYSWEDIAKLREQGVY